MRTKTCFLPGRPSFTPLPHTLHIRLANTPTSLTTVHPLVRYRHPVADSSTVLSLEFSPVRVTSTQVHTLDRSTIASNAVWTVATLVDDRCHQSSNVLWTIMIRWVLFSAVQGGESGGTRDQERNTQLSWIRCILCRIQTGFTSFEVPYSNFKHSHLPPLSQHKASFLSPDLVPTPSSSKSLSTIRK